MSFCSKLWLVFRLIFVAFYYTSLSISGALLVSIGYDHYDRLEDVKDAIPSEYDILTTIPVITIFTGLVIFTIAINDGFVDFMENHRTKAVLRCIYTMVLIAAFILQIFLVFFNYTLKDINFESRINASLAYLFSENSDGSSMHHIDLLQKSLRCCGVYGPEFSNPIPQSCCASDTCYAVFKHGCLRKLSDFVFVETTNLVFVTTVSSIIYLVVNILKMWFLGVVYFLKSDREQFAQDVYNMRLKV